MTRGQFAYLVNLVGRQQGRIVPTSRLVAQQLGWMAKENCAAAYNPFATTLPAPGAWAYNDIRLEDGAVIHVWNYPTWQVGVTAYLDTLDMGPYPHIRDTYAIGAWASTLSVHPDIDVWGTGDFTHEIPTTSQYWDALAVPIGV